MNQVDNLLVKPAERDVPTAESYMIKYQFQKGTNSLLYYSHFENRLRYCDFPTIKYYQDEDQQL